MPERSTRDLDIVVLTRDSSPKRVVASSRPSFAFKDALVDRPIELGDAAGVPIDVIEGRESRWPTASLKPLPISDSDRRTGPAAALPRADEAGSPSRMQDVSDVGRSALDRFRRSARRRARHQSQQPRRRPIVEDLDSVIALGKLEPAPIHHPAEPPTRRGDPA